MDFLEFLNKSVTPYHTVESLKALLACAEDENVQLFERGGALIAVRPPKEVCSDSKFRIALAHTDYPTLKITPNPDSASAGVRTLHPEIYGSPLFTSWLDRDLGYAGLLAYERNGKLETKLVRGDKLFRTFDGKDILYHGESPVYPIFISEPAYYEKDIAMSLTVKSVEEW